ncbi:MAG: GTP-binding protein, partial [Evtepia sp.]
EHDAHGTCDHDHDEHDAHCTCGHDHDEHDAHCGCGHHHDHDADEVFSSWGVETPRKYTEDELQQALAGLEDADRCGMVLRAKGIVPSATGAWLHFDYVPGESNVRTGTAEITGRLCVIGAKLKENELETLFLLK